MCVKRADGLWVGVAAIRPSDPALWWWEEVPRFDKDWVELEKELTFQAKVRYMADRELR